MSNWTSFQAKFSGSHASVISALEDSYMVGFGIGSYKGFVDRGDDEIAADMLQMNATDNFLMGLADYLLDRAAANTSGIWGDYADYFDVVDLPWVNVVVDFYDSGSFATFAALPAETIASDLASMAGGPPTIWELYVEALWSRVRSLSLDDFAASFEDEDDAAAIAEFCDKLVDAEVIEDFDDLLAMKKGEFAFQVSSLGSSDLLPVRLATVLIELMAGLQEDYPADDELADSYQGLVSQAYTSALGKGMMVLVEDMITGSVIDTLADLGTLSPSVLSAQIVALTPGHAFLQGAGDWLITKVHEHHLVASAPEAVESRDLALRLYTESMDGDQSPVAGYVVEVQDKRYTYVEPVVARYVTNAVGMISFQYPIGDPEVKLQYELVLTPLGGGSTTLVSSLLHDPADGDALDVLVTLPAAASPYKTIAQLETAIGSSFDGDLMDFLETEGLLTLESIRLAGGLARMSATAVQENLAEAVLIDRHAQLELIGDDLEKNHFLIEEGYTSLVLIAERSRADFVTALSEAVDSPFSQVGALSVWNRARKVYSFLRSHVMSHAGDMASGAQSRHGDGTGEGVLEAYEEAFGTKCDCPECSSGVSPLAYLASLLDYAQKYVKNSGSLVDADDLQTLFRHPYCELPADCASVKEEVCQVRVAVEVLRQHLSGDASWALKRPYVEQAYRLLLTQAGTSLEELRLVATQAGTAEKERLADRLGILPDEMEALHLDISLTYLTEHNLELLFGLQDTMRHPLSTGIKEGDTGNEVYSWRFGQVYWKRNTDEDGWVYLDINLTQVKAYRSPTFNADTLVASGTLSAAAPWTVHLKPVDDYGLSGRIELTSNTVVTDTVKVSVLPRLLAWRLKGLRRRWIAEDWAEASAYFGSGRLPYIDPDVVSPADFRGVGDGSTTDYLDQPIAYKVWATRRYWLDETIGVTELVSHLNTDDLDLAMAVLLASVDYMTVSLATVTLTPWDLGNLPSGYTSTNIEDLFNEVRANLLDPALHAGAVGLIQSWLRMSMDAWTRIDELEQRFRAGSPDYTAAERADLLAILLQSVKKTFFSAWVTEEIAEDIDLTETIFWPPMVAPRLGSYNLKPSGDPFAMSASDVPFLDPDLHSTQDLVPPAFGDTIHSKRALRVAELLSRRDAIYADRVTDYEEMFDEAYQGSIPTYPGSLTSMPEVLAHLNYGEGSAERIAALEYVTGDLRLSEAEFREIMEIAQREIASISVSDADYLRMADLLTLGSKRALMWPAWAADEGADNLFVYWMFHRAGLSEWAGGKAQRTTWEMALKQNSRVPMVDPDLVGPGDFFDPEYRFDADLDNPAFALWWVRNNAMNGSGGWLSVIAAATLANNLSNEIGTTSSELNALHTLYEEGVDVSPRLLQLGLSADTLANIVNILALSSPSTEERAVFDAIVLDVKRRRLYGKWNDEERAAELSLGPDYFMPPYRHAAERAAYVNALLKPWRGRNTARRKWEDRLKARMDQEAALMAGHHGMLQSVEGDSLRTLRDILLMKDADPDETLAERAAELSGRLLTDMDTACCKGTTRVAAAIETLQQLFHGLRTSQLDSSLSSLSLASSAQDFDADWRWLGSYANWRGLMFVYLYPENLLLPSLRAQQTGTFSGLVDQLRNNPRLTPDLVCGVMKQYENYLSDLHSLRLGASVTTSVRTQAQGCGGAPGMDRVVHFMFARGGDSMQVYWSSYDESGGSNVPQSFWEPVPDMVHIHKIVGAFVYEIQNGERYLYVMGIKQPAGREQPELVGNRYHLGTHRWQSDLQPFTAPANNWSWVVGERPDEHVSPVFGVSTYALDATWSFGSKAELKLQFQLDRDLFNRTLMFNRLSADGTTWEHDDFVKVEVNWVESFRLDAIIQPTAPYPNHVIVIGRSEWKTNEASLGYFSWEYGLTQPKRVMPLDRAGLNSPAAVTSIWGSGPSPEKDAFLSYVGKAWDLIQLNLGMISGTNNPIMPGNYVGCLFRRLNTSPSLPARYSLYYRTNTDQTMEFVMELTPTTNPNTLNGIVLSLVQSSVEVFDSVKVGPAFRHVANQTPIPSSFAFQSLNPGASIHLGLVPVLGGSSLFQLLRLSPMPDVIHPLLADGLPASNRKNAIEAMFNNNALYTFGNAPQSSGNPNWVYLEEAYYHLPMLLALELQKQRFYVEALDIYRLIFDYSQAQGQRKVYYGLVQEESQNNLMQNVFAWLDEPENPHTLAAQRAHSYTRFTVFSIVRCLLDYADQEYTRDTAESVPRAKMLYSTAAKLLREEYFAGDDPDCDEVLAGFDAQVDDAGWLPVWIRLRGRITDTNDHDLIHRLIDGYTGGTPYDGIEVEFASGSLTWEEKITRAEAALQVQLDAQASVPDRLCTVLSQYGSSAWNLPMIGGGAASGNRMALLVGSRGDAGLNQVLAGLHGSNDLEGIDWLGEENPTGTVPQGRASGYKTEGGYWANQYEHDPLAYLAQSGVLQRSYVPYSNHYFCVPRNPVPDMLLFHAELNLYKIRHCMNIAGIKRSIEPYAAATDNVSGMPVIGAGGQILFPGEQSVPSTGYRYEFLLAKAKELSQYAQQLESALLSSLEKRDAEHYNLMKARQDVKVAQASVRLQDLRIREAENGVTLAEMQRNRSQVQIDGLQAMMDAGLNAWESRQLVLAAAVPLLEAAARKLEAHGRSLTNSTIAAGLGAISGGATAVFDGAHKAVTHLYNTVVYTQAVAESGLSIAGIYASFERRKQEWQFQQVLAREDLKIGGQQITLAQDRLRVVGQERHISGMQMDHAGATLDFLLNKFTNAELYDWMSRVLEGVYAYFLQQATAMAKLAQQQLAFERQMAPPALVQDDYWYPSSENVNFEAGEGTRVDRKGLTGSTRLLQDITRLDLYAFETLQRKQQITRTLSLSQLYPAEFAQFRQTGEVTFRTPMEIFDRDFPGHYLRLIRKVRTTVVALVPPMEGVKARLSTTGIAQVVTGPEVFQTVRQTRGAESVALSGGYNDSGLFEMNPLNGELLNPFEGMGVDAIWEFRMDKVSNPFDFELVADVLLTIEYTALESPTYREQVLNALGNTVSGEASFSMKYSFPDQWYDLHHASDTASPYRVTLSLSAKAFPAHLRNVRVAHVSLLCVLEEDGTVAPTDLRLGLFKVMGGTALGGVASANVSGMASTRHQPSTNGSVGIYGGNALQWTALMGVDAAGDWVLDFIVDGNQPENSQQMLDKLFEDEQLRDLLLIVSYEADL